MAEEPTKPEWKYSPELLTPFWEGDVTHRESVLFIRDESTGESRASVLFPVVELLSVASSAGDVVYESGKDYLWTAGSREIVLPPGSKIPSRTPAELRRPAKSQKYELSHRDGNGEIFFGGELQYAEMQTCITYRHANDAWRGWKPDFDPKALPRTVARLVNRQPIDIVSLGDSITAGANASGLFSGAPYQPAYPELVRRQLAERFRGKVTLTDLAVGGTDTGWGLTQVEKVIEAHPNLVILAFGMNDSGGRSPESYGETLAATIAKVREKLPECEFILVASMLGNRDWVRLNHEYFPRYRDELAKLVEPGVALADLTSIWEEFLSLKKDWDQSGNGVNHPNDFGHRVYAQTICALVDPRGEPDASIQSVLDVASGPLVLSEQRLLGNYTYSYASAAADFDADGDLDLTSSDAEPNSNLYLLTNDGAGGFTHSFIQKYAGQALQPTEQPIRLERHAVGDINRDGLLDVVIVDNLNWDIRWFENPGKEKLSAPWPLHRVCAPQELPGAYDVALADLDGDGDLDAAASSWRYGNRFDWFENLGEPVSGGEWRRHEVASDIGETRTVAVVDFNRDGRPDLLGTSRTGNQILWFANPTNPRSETWSKTVIDGETVAPTHGHPVDMDGDGDLDVVMAFGIVAPVEADSPASHQVAWYENIDGQGADWKKHSVASGFEQGFEAVAGDLDGDGDVDIVATAWGLKGRLAWFENSGDSRGDWKEHAIKDGWPNAVTVILADLDRDGRLDIVASAERGANELRWWRNATPIR